jgi:hypothetical protein
MKLYKQLIILIIIALMSLPAMSQKLYRWVDKDGNVHYSDQVPPEAEDQARDQLNESGMVVDSIDKAAAPEQAEAASEEQLLLQQQLIEDEKLDKSYASEKEIIETKQRKVASLELAIRHAKTYVDTQAANLERLEKHKAEVEAGGGKVSDALQSMIDDVSLEMKQQEETLQGKIQERDEIVSYYDNEQMRYRAMRTRKQERGGEG